MLFYSLVIVWGLFYEIINGIYQHIEENPLNCINDLVSLDESHIKQISTLVIDNWHNPTKFVAQKGQAPLCRDLEKINVISDSKELQGKLPSVEEIEQRLKAAF